LAEGEGVQSGNTSLPDYAPRYEASGLVRSFLSKLSWGHYASAAGILIVAIGIAVALLGGSNGTTPQDSHVQETAPASTGVTTEHPTSTSAASQSTAIQQEQPLTGPSDTQKQDNPLSSAPLGSGGKDADSARAESGASNSRAGRKKNDAVAQERARRRAEAKRLLNN